MLVGVLAAAVLWMHVLAGSGTHHGRAPLPDGGAGHRGHVALVEGHPTTASATTLAAQDGILPAGSDQHGGAGPMCLMVLVALVTIAARGALRRRAPWHPPGRAACAATDRRAPVPDRPPDLDALGISRT